MKLSRPPIKSMILSLLLAAGAVHAEMPQVSEARIVQPPPGSPVAAGYMTIHNVTDEPLVITDASSDTISKVEVHLSVVENDVARMIRQTSVTIPAGETLQFKHGSYHVMLMGLTESLQPGDTVDITLETSAGPVPIIFPVLTLDAAGSMSGMQHEGMQHDGMKMAPQ